MNSMVRQRGAHGGNSPNRSDGLPSSTSSAVERIDQGVTPNGPLLAVQVCECCIYPRPSMRVPLPQRLEIVSPELVRDKQDQMHIVVDETGDSRIMR